MGWAFCGKNETIGKEMGYGVRGVCAHPKCKKEIDHGLAYVCGDMHLGGEHGCGDYFCYEHLIIGAPEQLCKKCYAKWSTAQRIADDAAKALRVIGGEK